LILYVLRYWPALTETFVAREVAELTRRGVPVAVASLGTRADSELSEPSPVPTFDARAAGPLATWSSRARNRHPALTRLADEQSPKAAARAAWLAERSGVSRTHAHFCGEAAEVARAVAEVAGVPFSVTVHAADLFKPRPSLPDLLRAARPVVTVCEHHRRWIEREYGVRAEIVRCGVDPVFFDVTPSSPSDVLRVIAVARDVPKKGLDLLAAAVRQDPGPISLRLVSDADRLAGDRITTGLLRPSQVPAALTAADVFALPCRQSPDGDRDGIPVALLEAMAAGLPVITTAVAGIPEVVDDEVGWLLPPDDPSALSTALRQARDPLERVRRGRAARARIASRGLTVSAQVDGILRSWDLA
jgi:glycosyltransferase involved in cell wall biosynthesis